MLILLSLALTLHPGDKIIWGEDSNCKGIVLSVQDKLLQVQGTCVIDKINFYIKDYISSDDVKKILK